MTSRPQVSDDEIPLAPVSSGHADVNGLKLHHKIYGQGEPHMRSYS
jgi:hypothetical protein